MAATVHVTNGEQPPLTKAERRAEQGSPSLGTSAVTKQVILCYGDHPVPCTILSRIPSCYPKDASNTPSQLGQPKTSLDIARCPCREQWGEGSKLPLLKNPRSRCIIISAYKTLHSFQGQTAALIFLWCDFQSQSSCWDLGDSFKFCLSFYSKQGLATRGLPPVIYKVKRLLRVGHPGSYYGSAINSLGLTFIISQRGMIAPHLLSDR